MAGLTRRFLPLVIALVISMIVVGTFALVYGPTGNSTPRVTFTPSSVTITFSASTGSSAPAGPVSLVCSPATTGPVVLIARTNHPGNLQILIIPNQLLSCGGSPSTFRLVASCVSAANQCRGTYQGQISVIQPSTYQNLASSDLKITVVVN